MSALSSPAAALPVFLVLFLSVIVLGILASKWKAGDLHHLSEWSLGGQKFGILVTWFLVGGDFYTAYTVIAVPALVYAVGGYGFFALPYTILVYPFVFAVMPRLWSACRAHRCLTAADWVERRYGSRWLMLAVAFTSLVATLPYIALQLEGMEAVMAGVGLGHGRIPLLAAFLLLSIFTRHSGLRGPAMIAFVKDVMIYVVVVAAVVWIPLKLGGYPAIFHAADAFFQAKGGVASLTLPPGRMLPYATLALGSALAGFMYPHTMTGILSSSNADAIRWNAILLPAYSLLLGLIALLGYMAIAAGVSADAAVGIVPALFQKMFPGWFVGFSFAGIAIAALVPASIMAIGTATLFTRNIWKPFFRPGLSPEAESACAKRAAIGIKLAALGVVLFLPTQYAIDLQLLGGVYILQILPAVVFGLSRLRLDGPSVLAGWAAGMAVGTVLALQAGLKPVVALPLPGGGWTCYIGVVALAANIAVTLAGSAWRGGAPAPEPGEPAALT